MFLVIMIFGYAKERKLPIIGMKILVMKIEDINNYNSEKFIDSFKNIYEESKFITEHADKKRPFKNKKEMFRGGNDQKAETMSFLIDVIDSHIDKILQFNKANIVEQLQEKENATAINIMTRDLMKTNILTFIKIRNDQDQEGVNNARFNIELDEGGNKQKHMLLQYNDDNEKYYEQDVTSSEGRGFNVAKDLIDDDNNDKFKQEGNNIQMNKYDRK